MESKKDILINSLISSLIHCITYFITFFICFILFRDSFETKYSFAKEDKELKELLKKLENKKNKIPIDIFQSLKKEISTNFANDKYRLTMIVDLPWNTFTAELDPYNDYNKIMQNLNATHDGLDDLKKEAIKAIQLQKYYNDQRILLLVGCKGNGKSSFAKSIAKALNRKFCQISFAGSSDEHIIRGSKKVYLGAGVGNVIKGIRDCGSSNPVILLDEIDKVGRTNLGNDNLKQSLLELLDPTQNKRFHDHFIDVDFDLSKVLFIATANNVKKIDPILRDRLNKIEIPNYPAEKMQKIISKKMDYKIKQLKQNVFDKLKTRYSISSQQIENWQITIEENFFLAKLEYFDKLDQTCQCKRISIRDLERIIGSIILEEEEKVTAQLLSSNNTKEQILTILREKIIIQQQPYLQTLENIYNDNRKNNNNCEM